MLLEPASACQQLQPLIEHYTACLNVPTHNIAVTTERQTFKVWRGWFPSSRCAGCYSPPPSASDQHVIYLNLHKCADVEVVIAEECVHLRDWLHAQTSGMPMRRHRRHGYDAIAEEVALLTGRSLDQVRAAVLGPQQRPYRYIYACRTCGREVRRRRTGRWSCGRCDSRFNLQHLLVLKATLQIPSNEC